MQFSGKTAVVTGGSRGIGKSITESLVAKGAKVAVIYASNSQMAEQLRMPGTVEIYQCDVSDYDKSKETVERIISDFIKIDILVNSAGITADKLLLRMSENDFDRVIAVNLKGTFNMIKHLVPHFSKNRYGRIINLSSYAGIHGNFGQVNYSASKSGTIGLTKSVAKEFAKRGITCNAVAPGLIDTDMTNILSDSVLEKYLEAVPSGRIGTPEDVAAAVLFLASDEASYITGTSISVDGGLGM
jgi:3-oxoacyl-[acyl-carrier protein] reductase